MSTDLPGNPEDEGSRPQRADLTPPKSAERIRATLQAIREQAPSAATTGPLSQGLQPEDRLVIASFYDRENRQRYQDALLAQGIGSTCERRDGQDRVLVDVGDREVAARLRDEHMLAWPDRPQARGRRLVDFVLLGAALGATISLAMVADRSFAKSRVRWGLIITSAIAFTLYGALVGGLLGSLKERLTERGRLQFSVVDLLLLAALVALAALALRLKVDLGLP
ncbi:MAG TPA: hypothetical protein VG826_08685 [Pirellulales bacterium]|nr:hypothetical protein [Pirellulales bacterium]